MKIKPAHLSIIYERGTLKNPIQTYYSLTKYLDKAN